LTRRLPALSVLVDSADNICSTKRKAIIEGQKQFFPDMLQFSLECFADYRFLAAIRPSDSFRCKFRIQSNTLTFQNPEPSNIRHELLIQWLSPSKALSTFEAVLTYKVYKCKGLLNSEDIALLRNVPLAIIKRRETLTQFG